MSEKKTMSALLSTQLNAEEQENNSTSNLVEIKDIEQTPFKAIKRDDVWRIIFGNYALTPELQSFEDCENYLENNFWEFMGAYVLSMVESYSKFQNIEK